MRIHNALIILALVTALPAMGQEDPGGGGAPKDQPVTIGDGPPKDQAVTISGFVDARYLSASEDASGLPVLHSPGEDTSTFQLAEGRQSAHDRDLGMQPGYGQRGDVTGVPWRCDPPSCDSAISA